MPLTLGANEKRGRPDQAAIGCEKKDVPRGLRAGWGGAADLEFEGASWLAGDQGPKADTLRRRKSQDRENDKQEIKVKRTIEQIFETPVGPEITSELKGTNRGGAQPWKIADQEMVQGPARKECRPAPGFRG